MEADVSTKPDIIRELDGFDTVSLDELSRVSLLNRVDTKYLGRIEQLEEIFPEIKQDYLVLKHMNKYSHEYMTTYMDTVDLMLYKAHHQGRSNRYKIRTREYVDSGQVFNEIKFKDNKKTTHKKRIERSRNIQEVDSKFLEFIRNNTNLNGKSSSLNPTLTINYKRVTFTDRNFSERITLDYDLRFNLEKRNDLFSDVFIMEVKRSRFGSNSEIEAVLRREKIHPRKMSKYCVGLICTRENIKHNRFKPLMRQINKINIGVF